MGSNPLMSVTSSRVDRTPAKNGAPAPGNRVSSKAPAIAKARVSVDEFRMLYSFPESSTPIGSHRPVVSSDSQSFWWFIVYGQLPPITREASRMTAARSSLMGPDPPSVSHSASNRAISTMLVWSPVVRATGTTSPPAPPPRPTAPIKPNWQQITQTRSIFRNLLIAAPQIHARQRRAHYLGFGYSHPIGQSVLPIGSR